MDGSIPEARKINTKSGRMSRRLSFAWGCVLGAALIPSAVAGTKPATKAPANPRQPTPELSLAFEALGLPGISQNLLNAGASLLTVHFVDNDHLLVTFGSRELVPRLPGDPPEHDDRLVAGELIELPTGKILARTRWHMHDHARYLWDLGQGRFLLREGDALSTFAPLANLATPDPFFRVPLPYRPGVLDTAVVSTDGRLLTIETHPREKKRLTGVDINLLTHNGDPFPKSLLYLDFYRIAGAGTEASPFTAVRSGTARAERPIRLPVDGDGYLVATGGKRGKWAVDFEGFSNKALPVGSVDSVCPPALEFVSPTQWLAFACRNSATDSMTLTAYDFAKHEIWEEPMGTMTAAATFALAPAASRFAMSRIGETVAPQSGPVSSEDTGAPVQEVRVYGTQTGDLLLKLNCTPSFRTAENFDLSSDGMRVAVVRNGAIEIYRLPELTRVDRDDLVELHKLEPVRSNAAIDLRRLRDKDEPEINSEEADSADANPPPATKLAPAVTDPSSSASPVAASPTSAPAATHHTPTEGQVTASATEPARKPPSLLNPGEKPEFGKPNSNQPQ